MSLLLKINWTGLPESFILLNISISEVNQLQSLRCWTENSFWKINSLLIFILIFINENPFVLLNFWIYLIIREIVKLSLSTLSVESSRTSHNVLESLKKLEEFCCVSNICRHGFQRCIILLSRSQSTVIYCLRGFILLK